MQFDYSVCKLCGGGGNSIQYRLRMADVVVCKHCGFHYSTYLDDEYEQASAHSTLPHLDPKTIQYIEEKLQSNPERFERHIQLVEKYLQPPARMMDVGFGGALFLTNMLQKGYDCWGIELDHQYLLYAKEKLQLQHVFEQPIQDVFWNQYTSTMQAVVLWDVLEHVNQPIDFILANARLLAPGGYLFIDTPCRDAFYHRSGAGLAQLTGGRLKGFLHDLYSSHRFGHKQILSKADMQLLCTKAGLELVQIELMHELSFPYVFYLKKILKNPFLVKAALPLVKLFFRLFPIKNKMLVVAKKPV